MIVGTAGHIDHGKTSLVEALTKVNCDRLPAEKKRGLTIDLGFAFLPSLKGETIGFVDVPGHEKFLRNMLAGATGFDFVLLVVAADDGVMPQTREHIAILDLLGLKQGIAVISKCDLVDEKRKSEVLEETREALDGTGLCEIPIITASIATGESIKMLRDLLLSKAEIFRQSDVDTKLFRLSVDRVFTLHGIGTVVTGTVLSGTIRVDDLVIVSPMGLSARVRSLRKQGNVDNSARVGDRVALALVGKGICTDNIKRGDVVLDSEIHAPSIRFDASFRMLKNSPLILKQGALIRVHCAAAEFTGRLIPLSARNIVPGSDSIVQISLDNPISAAVGDRLVIRDISAQWTLGGGTILDLVPPTRGRKKLSRLTELAAIRDMKDDDALVSVLSGRRGWVDLNSWMRARALQSCNAKQLIKDNGLKNLSTAEHNLVFLPSFWHDMKREIAGLLDAAHEQEPDLVGVPLERMRRQLACRLPTPVFAAFVRKMADDDELCIDRSWLRRTNHKVQFCIEEERILSLVLKHLDGDNRFRPPRIRDIAKSNRLDEVWLRRLMRMAARRGDVEEIAHDRFFSSDTTAEMVRVAHDLSKAAFDKRFYAKDFRDCLSNGRRVAIEVLEYFDWHGITIRQGDVRIFNSNLAANHIHSINWE